MKHTLILLTALLWACVGVAGAKEGIFHAVVAQDGSGDYTSIRQAVLEAPEGRTEPWIIFVRRGVYEEIVRIHPEQTNLCLIGEDRDSTILTFNITSNREHFRDNAQFPETEKQGPVLAANGEGFFLHNMTVINAWGYENQAGPQALALGSYADRFAMSQVSLYSYQDTWQTGRDEHRHYALDCYIEGAVDFIYCSGDVVFDRCTLGLCRKGTVIVAPSHGAEVKYGYVFRDCRIVSSREGVKRERNSFGRPWHNRPRCSFINTTLSDDIEFTPAGWTDHMGGLPAVFADYNTQKSDGSPVDLSQRNTFYWRGKNRAEAEDSCLAQAHLTPEEVALLTPERVLSGQDGWNPVDITCALPAPSVSLKGRKLKWNLIDGAIGYLVYQDGRYMGSTKTATFKVNDKKAAYQVRAINPYGCIGQASR